MLRQLVYDSPKVREVLGNECQSLWPPIVVILDVICPRNPSPEEQHDEHDVPLPESEVPKKGLSSFLQGCFVSATSQVPLESDIHDYVTQELSQLDVHTTPVINTRDIQLPWLTLGDYGPPRVQINKFAWELLVLSRRCIDECMNIMGLHAADINMRANTVKEVELEMSPRGEHNAPVRPPKPNVVRK